MNKCFDTKDSTSTPERKKEFIHRWLEENVQSNTGFMDSNEQTPSSPSLRQNTVPNEPVSPIFNRKNLESACPNSPLLGRKRLASSPIIGNRKKVFRKVRKVILNKTKEKDSKIDTSLKSTQKCDEKCNITFSETVKLSETHETSNTTSVKEFKIKNDPKTPKIEDNVSQIIESASSDDKSTENTEVNVQEDYSDSDKTTSDLIEEISTQIELESLNKESKIQISQISNPSSASSSSDDTHISEFPTTQVSSNQQPSQAATSTDFIDSISTLESKVNFSKTACMLHYTNNKQKRKKNIKKGSLLDTLNIIINKERSNVNLLRHQLNKNAANIANKPFILLQVVQHLPMINDCQMLKCILIDDSTNLLSNLFKSQFITVMNVPEISCKINDSQKPILKVFEPWTVMDPDQLLLHITRFIAIPSNGLKEFDISKNDNKTDMKVIYEFNCPCVEEKELSSRCKDKDCDTKYNIANIIFNS